MTFSPGIIKEFTWPVKNRDYLLIFSFQRSLNKNDRIGFNFTYTSLSRDAESNTSVHYTCNIISMCSIFVIKRSFIKKKRNHY